MNDIPLRNINDMTGPSYTNDNLLTSLLEAKNDNLYRRLKQLYPCLEDVTKLPQCWSTEARAQSLGLTWDNLGCYFRSTIVRRDDDEKIAAAVVTDNHIIRSCLIYYYEITIVSKGREGSMGIGLAWIKNTNEAIGLAKLPGWGRQTYGYHADDGNIFNADGRGGHSYGPEYSTGDVIGCGLNLVEGTCFFTRNGINLGTAFKDLPTQYYFYPMIGLRTQFEEILANFGQEEFRYNIDQDLRYLRKNMTFAISNYPISNFTDWQNTLHKLVQSWLIQNSYSNTAEAFSKSTKLEFKENRSRLKQRQKIQESILNGQISEAISLIPKLSPNFLQDNPNLLFALKCRQFIELIIGSERNFNSLESFNSFAQSETPDSTNGSGDPKMVAQQDSGHMTTSGLGSAEIKNDSVISMEDNNTMNGGDTNCNANGSGAISSINNNNNNNDNNCGQLDVKLKQEPLNEDAKLEGLLQFGQDLSSHLQKMEKIYGKNEFNERLLHESLSLIAFIDPHQTNISKLLDPSERQNLSQLVNNSLAEAESGDSHRLPMDDVMNHLRRIIKLNDSYGRWLLEKLC